MIQKIVWGILLMQLFDLCAAQRSTILDRSRDKPWFVPVQDAVRSFVGEVSRKNIQDRTFTILGLQQVIQDQLLSSGHQAADQYDSAVDLIQETMQNQLPVRIGQLQEEELVRAAHENRYPFYPDVSMNRLCAQELSDVGSLVHRTGIAVGTAATAIAVAALRYPEAFKTGYEMVEARAKYILTVAVGVFGLWRVLANIAKYHAFEVDKAVIENQLGNVDTNTLVQSAIINPLQHSLMAQRTAARVDGLVTQVRQVQSALSEQGRRSASIHREVVAGRQENAERFASVRTGVGRVERNQQVLQGLVRALGMSVEELRGQMSGVGQRVDGVAQDVASLHGRLDAGAVALRAMEERLRGDMVRAVVAVSGLSSSESTTGQTSGLVGLVLKQMTGIRGRPRLPDSSRPEEE